MHELSDQTFVNGAKEKGTGLKPKILESNPSGGTQVMP
jgi:hypothetical protein